MLDALTPSYELNFHNPKKIHWHKTRRFLFSQKTDFSENYKLNFTKLKTTFCSVGAIYHSGTTKTGVITQKKTHKLKTG